MCWPMMARSCCPIVGGNAQRDSAPSPPPLPHQQQRDLRVCACTRHCAAATHLTSMAPDPAVLAGWQLLAEQVQGVAAARATAAGDSGDEQSSGEHASAARRKANSSSSQGLHGRSHSNGSNLSEESGLGAAAAVTPRPHQWLYKEYKILDEIGSGGFGRVCRCARTCKAVRGGVAVGTTGAAAAAAQLCHQPACQRTPAPAAAACGARMVCSA